MATSYRTENDSMGEIKVESSKLWGAQTQRSYENFDIGRGSTQMPLEVVHAQAIVKRCAALANFKIGKLDKEKCDLITKAADEETPAPDGIFDLTRTSRP